MSLDGLKSALEADLFTTAASAAGLGLLFHQTVIRNVELDVYMYHFLFLFIVALAGLASTYLALTDLTILQALSRVALVAISFDTGLFFSIGIYRLLFHRLRKFPGPLGAKLTRFYTVSKAAKNVQYYKEVEKMHEKYGDFIRTGESGDMNSS